MRTVSHAYDDDDVFSHPELLVSLEDAGIEEFNLDTVSGALAQYWADESGQDAVAH